jgi:hypothetical protein
MPELELGGGASGSKFMGGNIESFGDTIRSLGTIPAIVKYI